MTDQGGCVSADADVTGWSTVVSARCVMAGVRCDPERTAAVVSRRRTRPPGTTRTTPATTPTLTDLRARAVRGGGV